MLSLNCLLLLLLNQCEQCTLSSYETWYSPMGVATAVVITGAATIGVIIGAAIMGVMRGGATTVVWWCTTVLVVRLLLVDTDVELELLRIFLKLEPPTRPPDAAATALPALLTICSQCRGWDGGEIKIGVC